MVASARLFVPADLNPAEFGQLEPIYRALLERHLDSGADLELFLRDLSELSAVMDEYGSRRYTDMTCHTDDKVIEAAYLHFLENILPRTKPLFFRLQQKFLASPALAQLRGPRYEILIRHWRVDVELFREANVPIETEMDKAINEYDKISGAMLIEFRGKQYTAPQMARFLEETDRATRQQSWEATVRRRLEDGEKIEAIFEQLLQLRVKIAANAAVADYRAYIWKAKKRFDYTAEDCLRFADAVAATCVPVLARLNAQRAKDLGVATLRPWDIDVDVRGRAPLRPFTESQIPLFVQKTREIFNRISPHLAADFDQLSANGNLDLDSRPAKAPGGYQQNLEESKQQFIFMNAAGLHRDVEVLLHEGGHAFHHRAACSSEPLVFLRNAPMEFCEVASMTMEALGSEHLDVFYDQAGAARARRKFFEGIIRSFPWIATIDSFQHWLYTHPGHTPAERTAAWLALLDRFAVGVDWTGYEPMRAASWHRQLHLFHVPFYYIEYGIAQLGALQIWLRSRHDPRQALANYRAALALGGTRPLPDLFSTAGIAFDFSRKTMGPLIDALEEELEALPV